MADQDSSCKDEESKGLLKGKQISRRDFLKMAGATGATIGLAGGLGGIIAACGDDEPASGGTTVSVGGEATGREIKIGFVSPLTGGIAAFGEADTYCAERAAEAIGDGIVCGDGKKHPVKIITKDSQSLPANAGQMAADLINNDGVDIMVTASTPDTVVPVATKCETLGVPCLSNDCPWQPFIDRTNTGDFSVSYKWTYHAFWGLEDVITNFNDMWSQVSTNKKVGATWSNDPDGQAWMGGWGNAFGALGYTATIPSQFTVGAQSFATQINQYRSDGCEIGVGMFIPPDMGTFWGEVHQLGWKPRVASFGKGLLFPSVVKDLTNGGEGLTTEVWWMPTHPFTSSLNGESCQVFADKWTAKTKQQWTQPLLHFIIFEWAVDVLKRCTDPDDKEAIMTAVKATKLDTIGGMLDFTAPVTATSPAEWTPGPQHIHPNVYKTPQVGGQWRKGTKYEAELTVVSNAACPNSGIEVQDAVKELAWS